MTLDLTTPHAFALAACLAARGIEPVTGSKVEEADGTQHCIITYADGVSVPPGLSESAEYRAARQAVRIMRLIDAAPRLIVRPLPNGKQLVISSNADAAAIRSALAAAS